MPSTIATIEAPASTEVATLTNAPLTWSTKNGTQRAAHSAVAQALAPRAVRLDAAQQATLAQLRNGQYKPFMSDVRAALSPAHAANLRAHVQAALSTVVDGIPMAPVDDALETANKKAAIAFCQWLQNPHTTRTIKGVTTVEAKPLAKGKLPLITMAAMWLADMA